MTGGVGDEPRYGELRLPPLLEAVRALSSALPANALTRRMVSVLRRVAMAGGPGPYDVEVFGGQKARLHPSDNLSEKRVFAAERFFDPVERAALSEAVRTTPGDRPFVFVDAGANVGLYTLSVRAAARAAGRAVSALAIEPDPENRRRLAFNLAANDAADVQIASSALAEAEGTVRLAPPGANRGEAGVGGDGAEVRAATLPVLIAEAGLGPADAVKIDIEGLEAPVLRAYFAGTARGERARLIVLETGREETEALALCRAEGYRIAHRTRLNTVLTGPGPED